MGRRATDFRFRRPPSLPADEEVEELFVEAEPPWLEASFLAPETGVDTISAVPLEGEREAWTPEERTPAPPDDATEPRASFVSSATTSVSPFLGGEATTPFVLGLIGDRATPGMTVAGDDEGEGF